MGTLTIITEPTVEPVTLAEAKTALRVDHSDDDTRITALIEAARRFAEAYTGMYIMPQTIEASMDSWPATEIELCVWPLESVDSVKYDDTASPVTEQTLTVDTDYYADTTTIGGRVRTLTGWPSVAVKPNAIRIRMTAGYPLAGSPLSGNAPEIIKEGVLAYVMFLYDNDISMKNAAEAILWSSRVL